MSDNRTKDRRQGAQDVDVDRRQGDRRRWQRVPVHLWAEASDGDATYFNQAADLSAGGVFFSAPIPLPVGTVVNLKLDVPAPTGGEETLEVRGVVVNAKSDDDPGMGVRFMDLTPESQKVIEAALAALEAAAS